MIKRSLRFSQILFKRQIISTSTNEEQNVRETWQDFRRHLRFESRDGLETFVTSQRYVCQQVAYLMKWLQLNSQGITAYSPCILTDKRLRVHQSGKTGAWLLISVSITDRSFKAWWLDPICPRAMPIALRFAFLFTTKYHCQSQKAELETGGVDVE